MLDLMFLPWPIICVADKEPDVYLSAWIEVRASTDPIALIEVTGRAYIFMLFSRRTVLKARKEKNPPY